MTDKYVCIVDAYSTGATLAELFKNDGWKVIHVSSQPEAPRALAKSYHPEHFCEKHVWEPSRQTEILLSLKAHRVEAVIAGSEPGVPLADELADQLGLPGNDRTTSEVRRNKAAMAEALKAAGLRAAHFAVARSRVSAISAAERMGRWPVVVKPVNAAGSEDVYICRTKKEVSMAFTAIYQKENLLGIHNREVLVQEYLSGTQYMCNAVSIDGHHRVTEIWQVRRKIIPQVGVLHDREVILRHSGDEQDKIIPYVEKVLTAVGIMHGASNTELMMTRSGPVLIETSARPQGSIHSAAVKDALDGSHATWTYKRYADPVWFLDHVADDYKVHEEMMVVHLMTPRPGVVVANECEERLKTLESFHSLKGTPDVGSHVPRTTNLVTSTGRVYLLHDDAGQLVRDYKRIRKWEKKGFLLSLVTPDFLQLSEPGGSAFAGAGSAAFAGPGSAAFTGPGSAAFAGPGSMAFAEPGGAAVAGPGGTTVAERDAFGAVCSEVQSPVTLAPA